MVIGGPCHHEGHEVDEQHLVGEELEGQVLHLDSLMLVAVAHEHGDGALVVIIGVGLEAGDLLVPVEVDDLLAPLLIVHKL